MGWLTFTNLKVWKHTEAKVDSSIYFERRFDIYFDASQTQVKIYFDARQYISMHVNIFRRRVDSNINSEASSWHRSSQRGNMSAHCPTRRAWNVGHGAVASVVVEAPDHRTGIWWCLAAAPFTITLRTRCVVLSSLDHHLPTLRTSALLAQRLACNFVCRTCQVFVARALRASILRPSVFSCSPFPDGRHHEGPGPSPCKRTSCCVLLVAQGHGPAPHTCILA